MGKVWWIKDIEEWIREHRPDLPVTERKPDDKPIGSRHGRTGPRGPFVDQQHPEGRTHHKA